MTTTINASTPSGLVNTADTSGIIKVQSNGVTTNALAWVNFNGTGTVAIRSSYNVSSITDNGTGDYTVNFTTALSDANYAYVFGGSLNRRLQLQNTGSVATTSSIRVQGQDNTNIAIDVEVFNVAIFGN